MQYALGAVEAHDGEALDQVVVLLEGGALLEGLAGLAQFFVDVLVVFEVLDGGFVHIVLSRQLMEIIIPQVTKRSTHKIFNNVTQHFFGIADDTGILPVRQRHDIVQCAIVPSVNWSHFGCERGIAAVYHPASDSVKCYSDVGNVNASCHDVPFVS